MKPRGIGTKKQKKAAPAPLPTFGHEELLSLLNKPYQSLDGAKEAQIYSKNAPFPHINLKNFFDDNFLEQLKMDLLSERYWQKNNDLYQFLQTKDLKTNAKDHISKLRSLLYGDHMRSFIEKVTGLNQRGLKLKSDTIDMSAACYRDTDHLLCHDDELEGRRIAYIVYLVPRDWSEQDGGALDLFNVDQNLQPRDVVTKLIPEWNSITFFEVSPVSYHQVAQILRDEERCEDRISVSGWYYCDVPIQRPEPYVEPAIEMKEPVQETDILRDWINETYFNEENRTQVMEMFSNNSSIELVDFLKKDKLVQIMSELKQKDSRWKMVGPANRRHFGIYQSEENTLQQLTQLFSSREFAKFLAELTQHEILKYDVKTRRFGNNCYTLVHDTPHEETRMDVVLCLLVPHQDDSAISWDVQHGGGCVYMDEDNELLSILPVHNSLSIVLREEGVMQFVKFVNHKAPATRFDICCAYEVPEIPPPEEGSWEDVDEENGDGDEEDYEDDE
jgi:Rps23 Pro-64 3,4-dihydroxylase Tpa1-like proline 4-hydroxylase